MLLAIDVGNTNIAFGVFEGEKMRATWNVATDINKTADEYAVLLLNLLPRQNVAMSDVDHVVICCVVPPLEPIFEELSKRYFGSSPLIVGAGVKTGVRICTDNPREVGADRVANVAAAHRLYSGPVIVIDFGTATTVDAISEEGDFLGAAIAPGIRIASEALQSGLIFGYVGLIESLVRRIRQELGGKARVIATGGLADIIAKETKIVDAVNPHLTLEGLRLIHEMNR
jgi:type III pantothenate kinase